MNDLFFLSVSGWHLRDIFKTAQKMDEKKEISEHILYLFI